MSKAEAPVRWGIIGASRIADEYVIPAIQADSASEVVAVASASAPKHAKEIADRHSVPHVVDSVAALVGRADVDAVYIGTTSDAHASQAIEAAQVGKYTMTK
jgi:1,5-anhydro-D-fructose reductase (1,5-anhydro-D-mannitol-forming)